jgi:hypothetical protein
VKRRLSYDSLLNPGRKLESEIRVTFVCAGRIDGARLKVEVGTTRITGEGFLRIFVRTGALGAVDRYRHRDAFCYEASKQKKIACRGLRFMNSELSVCVVHVSQMRGLITFFFFCFYLSYHGMHTSNTVHRHDGSRYARVRTTRFDRVVPCSLKCSNVKRRLLCRVDSFQVVLPAWNDNGPGRMYQRRLDERTLNAT